MENTAHNVFDYDSDIEDPGVEDQIELTEAELKAKSKWTKCSAALSLSVDTDTEMWATMKPRMLQIVRNIAHKIWFSDSRGWTWKVLSQQHTWHHLIKLSFPMEYFAAVKNTYCQ